MASGTPTRLAGGAAQDKQLKQMIRVRSGIFQYADANRVGNPPAME